MTFSTRASPTYLRIVDNTTHRVYQYDAAINRTSGSQAASTSFALAAGNTNPQGIADPPVDLPADRSVTQPAEFDAALLSLLEDLDGHTHRKRRR
jgi:hypothetical protein